MRNNDAMVKFILSNEDVANEQGAKDPIVAGINYLHLLDIAYENGLISKDRAMDTQSYLLQWMATCKDTSLDKAIHKSIASHTKSWLKRINLKDVLNNS